MNRFSVLLAIPCALGVLTLTACRKDEIVTYRVVNSSATPSAPSTDGELAHKSAQPIGMAGKSALSVPTAAGLGLVWTVPATWSPGPERAMRRATLLIPGPDGSVAAELAITAFPGDVGGNLANVNRWRQQLGLPPIAENELSTVLQPLEGVALPVYVVDLLGPNSPAAGGAQGVLGAIVPYAGDTWFFKLTGPDGVVAGERDNFLAFLRTLRVAS